MQQYIKRREVIAITKKTLRRIHHMCMQRHKRPSVHERVKVRNFLLAYVIHTKYQRVFESLDDPMVRTLRKSADVLAGLFEKIVGQLVEEDCNFEEVSRYETALFMDTLDDFLTQFETWTTSDKAKQLKRLKLKLKALFDEAKYENPCARVAAEFSQQVEALRKNYGMVGGVQALAMLDQVIGYAPLILEGGADAAVLEAQWVNAATSTDALAHELALDSSFRFTEKYKGVLHESKVKQVIRKSAESLFWESIEAELERAPPLFSRSLGILNNISGSLREITTDAGIHARLAEIIDVALIKQQLEAGTWNAESARNLAGAMVDHVIRHMQLPSREANTSAEFLRVSSELQGCDVLSHVFVGYLRFLVDRMAVLRLDESNARLARLLPWVNEQGVQYIRDKLRSKLQNGSITLDNTRQWLGMVLERLDQGTLTLIASGDHASVMEKIHCVAIVNLLDGTLNLGSSEFPETLQFDYHRILGFREIFRQLLFVCICFVTVRQYIPSSANALLKGSVLMDMVNHIFRDESAVDKNWTSSILDAFCEVVKKEDVHNFVASVDKRASDCQDPIFILMKRRLHEVWVQTIFMQDSQVTATLPGASEIAALCRDWASRAKRMVTYNRDVHSPVYDAMLQELAGAIVFSKRHS